MKLLGLEYNMDNIQAFGDVRLHGNGFIQVNLVRNAGRTEVDPSKRLHIWPYPKLQAQSVGTPIHTHTFGFISTVLMGRLFNIVYDNDIMKAKTHEIYVVDRGTGKDEDTKLIPYGADRPVHVGLRQKYIQAVEAYHNYTCLPMEVHETVPDGLTMTLMTKTPAMKGVAGPFVYCPLKYKPDNKFNRYDTPKDTLLGIVEDTIKKWREII